MPEIMPDQKGIMIDVANGKSSEPAICVVNMNDLYARHSGDKHMQANLYFYRENEQAKAMVKLSMEITDKDQNQKLQERTRITAALKEILRGESSNGIDHPPTKIGNDFLRRATYLYGVTTEELQTCIKKFAEICGLYQT